MNVRIAGLMKIVGSGVLYAVLFATVLDEGLEKSSIQGPLALIAVGLPGAIALAGLIELVTGFPFQRASDAWDHLAGWQRGVLGILIVIAAFALMMLGVAAFA